MTTVSTCSTSTRNKRTCIVLCRLRVTQDVFQCTFICDTELSLACAVYLSISLKAFGASGINTTAWCMHRWHLIVRCMLRCIEAFKIAPCMYSKHDAEFLVGNQHFWTGIEADRPCHDKVAGVPQQQEATQLQPMRRPSVCQVWELG